MATNTSPNITDKEKKELLQLRKDFKKFEKLLPELDEFKKKRKDDTKTAKKIAQEVKKPTSLFNQAISKSLKIPIVKAFGEGILRLKTAFGQYFSRMSSVTSGIVRTAFGKILDDLQPVIESFKATIDLFKTGFLIPMVKLFVGGPFKAFFSGLSGLFTHIKEKFFTKESKELEVAKKQLSVQDEMVKKLKRLKRIFKKIEYNTKNATRLSLNADAKYWTHRSKVDAKLFRIKEKEERKKSGAPKSPVKKESKIKSVVSGIGGFLADWGKPILGLLGFGLMALLIKGLWDKFMKTSLGQWFKTELFDPFISWVTDKLGKGLDMAVDLLGEAIGRGFHSMTTRDKVLREEQRNKRKEFYQENISDLEEKLKQKNLSDEEKKGIVTQIEKIKKKVSGISDEKIAFARLEHISEHSPETQLGTVIQAIEKYKDLINHNGYKSNQEEIESFIQKYENEYNIKPPTFAKGGNFTNGRFTVPGQPSKKDNKFIYGDLSELGYVLSLRGKENLKNIRGYSTGGSATVGEIIRNASVKTGAPLDIMQKIAASESGGNISAKAGTSSAGGLFQFVDKTWNGMLKNYGGKHGLSLNASKYDPWANSLMGGEYIKENYNAINSSVLNPPPTAADVYMAHFLGSGGAKRFFKGLSSAADSPAYQWVDTDSVNSNPTIFFVGGNKSKPRTLRQVYELMANKMKVDPSSTLAKAAGGSSSPDSGNPISNFLNFGSIFSKINPFGDISSVFSNILFGGSNSGVNNSGSDTKPLSGKEAGSSPINDKPAAVASAEAEKQKVASDVTAQTTGTNNKTSSKNNKTITNFVTNNIVPQSDISSINGMSPLLVGLASGNRSQVS